MRFTIRDVLWLIDLSAMGCAWWIDHRKQTAANYRTEMLDWKFRAEALKDRAEKAGDSVTFFKSKYGTQQVTVKGKTGWNGYGDSPRGAQ